NVCWNWPGIEAIATRSASPSFTKSGAIRSDGRTSVSRTSERSAGVRRRRRGRCTGKAMRCSVASRPNEAGGGAMGGMRLIRPADRVEGQPTIGMQREEAIATEGIWSGLVTAEAGTVSGWHHHGEFESVIYILKGAF